MKNNYNLPVSFIITYRKSCERREKNLFFVINNIKKYFPKSELILVEQDDKKKFNAKNINYDINHIFVYNNSKFNKNWGYNIGSINAKYNIFIFHDADVFMNPDNLAKSILYLENYDSVNPYNELYYLSKNTTDRIHKKGIDIRKNNNLNGKHMKRPAPCGGIYIIKKKSFFKIKGFPENFEGWGYEDKAIQIKTEKFTNNRKDLKDTLYHLSHKTNRKNNRKNKKEKDKMKNEKNKEKIKDKHIGNPIKYSNLEINIITRSKNKNLYNEMIKRFNYNYDNKIRFTNFQGFGDAATEYIYHILVNDYDWVINIDEDCFVFDEYELLMLLNYMKNNNYDYCGIPDGGVCIHRFHNPLVMNPFFNIFNVKKIREKIKNVDKNVLMKYNNKNQNKLLKKLENKNCSPMNLMKSPEFVKNNIKYIKKSLEMSPSLRKYHPLEDLKENGYGYKFDNFEPFNGLFLSLIERNCNPLYLNSKEYEQDGLSTIVKSHREKEICIHTWFSRLYGKNKVRKRINKAIKYRRY